MQAALVAIFNACKQSLGRGNVFIPVSQSFYPGGCLPLGLRGVHPLWTHTPWMPPQGEMATEEAGSTHRTRMHFCFTN